MAPAVLDRTRRALQNRGHMNAAHPIARRCRAGFTLIELMVALAVTGILLAVALPSFMDSIRKGRRSEAFAALSALQLAQERWRSNNALYTQNLSDLSLTSPTGPGGYYELTVVGSTATATGYVATANGRVSSQVNDGQCAKLSVQVDRGAILVASCASCTTFSYAATDPCWKR